MKVLILYFTKTGHTLEAVSAVAEGICSAGSVVDIVATADFDAADLEGYDGLIVGSPCWNGAFGSGIAKPVVQVLDKLPPNARKGKRGGGISVYGGVGGENTVKAIGNVLVQLGCEHYESGLAVRAGTPLSLWKGPSVSVGDEERLRAYGTQFVK